VEVSSDYVLVQYDVKNYLNAPVWAITLNHCRNKLKII
jgi:hypothetical protein